MKSIRSVSFGVVCCCGFVSLFASLVLLQCINSAMFVLDSHLFDFSSGAFVAIVKVVFAVSAF